MRRVLTIFLALSVLAFAAAGCGDSGPEGALDEGLAYMPKDSAVVVAVDTNPEGDDFQQFSRLIDKFAFANQIKGQIKQGVQRGGQGVDFDEDIRPLLGSDLVVGVPTGKRQADGSTPVIVALKVEDADKARDLVKRDATKVGEKDGAEIYQQTNGQVVTVDEDVIVGASTRESLEAALERRDGGDHLDEAAFEKGLGDLPKDALVRAYGNFDAILAGSPKSTRAKRVPWVGALESFGAALSAEDDGVAMEFNVNTEGQLADRDLPLAAGPQSPQVVKRGSEVGIGLRNLTQSFKFGEGAAQAASPAQSGDYQGTKQRLGRELGVDVDRDLIEQFSGDTSISIALDGGYAVRSAVRDARALEGTLAKVADGVPKLPADLRGESKIEKPTGGDGLYSITGHDGKRTYYGVVNGVFVAASDPVRAKEIAAQSPSRVEGAEGAIALSADSQAIANEIIKQQFEGVQSLAARAFTGPLGEIVGYVRATTDELRGKVKLKIE